MEASITTFTLVSTRLQLSTRRKRSTISELTEILNQYEEHQRSLLTMQARRRCTTGLRRTPPRPSSERGVDDSNKWTDIISCPDKESFLHAVRERLQEIGCYPIRGSSSTPTYTIPIRSPNINHRPSLHRMNATLSSWNGSNRHTLENHEMRGKLSLLALRPT